MAELDAVQLQFNPAMLVAMNVALALVMYGIALSITPSDFARVLRAPKAVLVGLLAQWLALPALTFALLSLLKLPASVALGMLLVAACPGGNISNFFTHLAGGNTALSMSLSAITTLAAVVVTPLSFAFWAGLNADTAQLLTRIALAPAQLFTTIGLILALPLVLGMITAHRWPALAARLNGPMRVLSMGVFGAFVVGALAANYQHFVNHVRVLAGIVAIHNGLALLVGFTLAAVAGVAARDRRALTLEVGIQNSGLALLIIFTFFDGMGGMATIAAWWGVWHIVSGFAVAGMWARRPLSLAEQPA